jgi:hypothetical protein
MVAIVSLLLRLAANKLNNKRSTAGRTSRGRCPSTRPPPTPPRNLLRRLLLLPRPNANALLLPLLPNQCEPRRRPSPSSLRRQVLALDRDARRRPLRCRRRRRPRGTLPSRRDLGPISTTRRLPTPLPTCSATPATPTRRVRRAAHRPRILPLRRSSFRPHPGHRRWQ